MFMRSSVTWGKKTKENDTLIIRKMPDAAKKKKKIKNFTLTADLTSSKIDTRKSTLNKKDLHN